MSPGNLGIDPPLGRKVNNNPVRTIITPIIINDLPISLLIIIRF
jgi:hypothetical protein